jgi:hypothetical protein
MALPQTVRVKISSEAAGAITLTAVVAQELPVRELVEHVLGLAGKDEARIREILLRGTLVAGASRFRWAGWEAGAEDLRALLATFPEPNPRLPFDPARCFRAVLRGGRRAIEIPREAAARKGLFRRATFWDVLMEIAVAEGTVYSGYSYRERADLYARDFSASEVARLRAASEALRYSTIRQQIEVAGFRTAELYATRVG